jgi:hypothetical protein
MVCRVVFAYALTIALQPSPAEAKGFMLVTYGDSVFHVADIPAERKEVFRQLAGQDVAVGYRYDYFGVFWVDLWTWGGQWCLYDGSSYSPLSAVQAAAILDTTPERLRKPFLYTFPLGLTIVIVLFGGLLLIGAVVKTDEQRAAKLRQDPRYVQAIQVFVTSLPAEEPDADRIRERVRAAFQSAVEHLTAQGVAPATADKNLKLLLNNVLPAATVAGPVPSTNSFLR